MRLLVLISRLHLTTDGLCVRALCDSSENKYPLLRVRQPREKRERERPTNTNSPHRKHLFIYIFVPVLLGSFSAAARVSD